MDHDDKIRAFTAYWDAYRAATTQFRTPEIAGQWWKLSLRYPQVTATAAASWARLGYLPHEAAPLIADGITPAMAREMEHHAEQAAGGPDALRDQRVQQMVDLGEIVDPATVVRVQDPTDPTREIITIRDERCD
jgi:hypothetical protein